jgi:hypothetical protein
MGRRARGLEGGAAMTLASSIRRASYMIREIASWLQNGHRAWRIRVQSQPVRARSGAGRNHAAPAADQIGERRTALIEKNDSGWSFAEMAEFEKAHQEAAE